MRSRRVDEDPGSAVNRWPRPRIVSLIAAGGILALGARTAVWLTWPADEPKTVTIRVPGGYGRKATREEIATFEAEMARCERSGATCAIELEPLPGTPHPFGWLTPIATR
jgi:hypothetical protein